METTTDPTPTTMTTRPTQYQLAESARRAAARRAHALNEMMQDPNRPTLAELAKLRASRPELWNAFPESACIDAKPATP